MNDALVLRSAVSLMETTTNITWSNKYSLPAGHSWNEDGYVITDRPYPFIRSCIGIRFSFLIGKYGMNGYIEQNLIALRMLNENVHRSIVCSALYSALVRAGYNVDKNEILKIGSAVYQLKSVPTLDSNFLSWRRTWFNENCEYDTINKIVRFENSHKIDSDRELMTIDTKYITADVAEFTGFSRSRIDNYWSEKSWNKKLRTLFTLEEALESLAKEGIISPTRPQLAEVSGISVSTISEAMRALKKMIAVRNSKALT